MDCPAQSLDLNSIENQWGMLSRSLYAGFRPFDDFVSLKNAIPVAWVGFTQNELRSLVRPMLNRLIGDIKNQSGPTKYYIDHLFSFCFSKSKDGTFVSCKIVVLSPVWVNCRHTL